MNLPPVEGCRHRLRFQLKDLLQGRRLRDRHRVSDLRSGRSPEVARKDLMVRNRESTADKRRIQTSEANSPDRSRQTNAAKVPCRRLARLSLATAPFLRRRIHTNAARTPVHHRLQMSAPRPLRHHHHHHHYCLRLR